jgi:hypothetical protein
LDDPNAARLDQRRLKLACQTREGIGRNVVDWKGCEKKEFLLKFKFVIVYFRRWKVEPAVEVVTEDQQVVRVVSS